MSDASLDRDQVLDELEQLATVEHAVIVEYLSVHWALGHDLEAEEGGATTEQGREASAVAAGLAQGEMFRLKDVNRALVAVGRSAELGRASSIDTGPTTIPLDPPTGAQLEQLRQREDDIAAAVDRVRTGGCARRSPPTGSSTATSSPPYGRSSTTV